MKNNVIKAAGIQIFCNTSKQGMLEKAEKYMGNMSMVCLKNG